MEMKRFFTSCFGLGRLPIAPGTWASLPIVLLFGMLKAMGASPSAITAIMVLMIVYGVVVCIRFAPGVALRLGKTDPAEIVADEWAGQALVFIALGGIDSHLVCTTMVLGFGLFRLFDIFKPWPIRKLEKLPGGIGILADDLAAGAMALIVLLLSWQLGLSELLSGQIRISEELNIFTAAILGAVQGVTEFLPVSSDGHLVLLQRWFGMPRGDTGPMIMFDLMVHMGTVASVFIVMRREIVGWLRRLFQFSRYGYIVQQVYSRSPALRILVLAIVADIVTAVGYFMFKSALRSSRDSMWLLVIGWIISGVLLIIIDVRKRGRLGLRKFDAVGAAWVGLAQAVAILPSVSRSGATIATASLFGLKRRWAVEFSFLAGIPLIVAANLKEVYENRDLIEGGGLNGLAYGVGAAVACLVGIFALKLLIRAARRASLKYFGYYCLGLAALVAVYILLS
jgi:undecaprenyl-diphosphatase